LDPVFSPTVHFMQLFFVFSESLKDGGAHSLIAVFYSPFNRL